jgi:hypothetical protein
MEAFSKSSNGSILSYKVLNFSLNYLFSYFCIDPGGGGAALLSRRPSPPKVGRKEENQKKKDKFY